MYCYKSPALLNEIGNEIQSENEAITIEMSLDYSTLPLLSSVGFNEIWYYMGYHGYLSGAKVLWSWTITVKPPLGFPYTTPLFCNNKEAKVSR